MRIYFAFPTAVALGLLSSGSLLAQDRFKAAVPYMKLDVADPETVKWFTIGAAILAVGLLVLAVLYNRKRTARMRLAGPAGAKKKRLTFRQQAGVLGFKFLESKILKRIADRLSPQVPETLLTTPSGRQYLMADLEKRIRRRQREVETLHSIQDKLEKMREEKSHERASIRLETDLPIWIVKKVQTSAAAPEGEDVFVNIEPVTGKLEDISEGGAAVSADLDVAVGDVVELWSTETGVWIPPITAGVVHREELDNAPPMLHLQFFDPPLVELRAALHEIQLRNNRSIFDQPDRQETQPGP